jgi:hypothetical protein
MSSPDYTRLKGVTAYARDIVTTNLEYGLIDFFTWAFLQVGAFQNITRTPYVSGIYGGSRCRLRPVDDSRYTAGRVWEGFRGDWVWESGIDWSTQPVHSTGVWVGGSFYFPNHTSKGHYIDYKRGRVVFNTAIPTTSVVETDFAPRSLTFLPANHPWVRKLMFDSFAVQREDFLTMSSGNWSSWSDVRLQLPVVGVEMVANDQFIPYELGGGQWLIKSVIFHVYGENDFDVQNIADAIEVQNDRTLWITNRAILKESGLLPYNLNYYGSLVNNPIQYPDLVSEANGYRWRGVFITDSTRQNPPSINSWLYRSIVRSKIEIVMGDI